jgi:hypothetical protein
MAAFVMTPHKTPVSSQIPGKSGAVVLPPGPFEFHMFHHLRCRQHTCFCLRLAKSDRNNVNDNENADADESEHEVARRMMMMNQLIYCDASAILCNARPLPVRGNMYDYLPLLKGEKFRAQLWIAPG